MDRDSPKQAGSEDRLRPMSDPTTYHLIELYKQYPCLYDTLTYEYRDRKYAMQAYINIGKALHMKALDVKKKIKGLRTQFSQNMMKASPSRWKFFQPLDFLRPHIAPRKMAKYPEAQPDTEDLQATERPVSRRRNRGNHAPVQAQEVRADKEGVSVLINLYFSLDSEVCARWRKVGIFEGLSNDTQIAIFLIEMYEERQKLEAERSESSARPCLHCSAPLLPVCVNPACQLPPQDNTDQSGLASHTKSPAFSPPKTPTSTTPRKKKARSQIQPPPLGSEENLAASGSRASDALSDSQKRRAGCSGKTSVQEKHLRIEMLRSKDQADGDDVSKPWHENVTLIDGIKLEVCASPEALVEDVATAAETLDEFVDQAAIASDSLPHLASERKNVSQLVPFDIGGKVQQHQTDKVIKTDPECELSLSPSFDNGQSEAENMRDADTACTMSEHTHSLEADDSLLSLSQSANKLASRQHAGNDGNGQGVSPGLAIAPEDCHGLVDKADADRAGGAQLVAGGMRGSGQLSSVSLVYSCRQCPATFSQQSHLARHRMRHVRFTCKICQAPFPKHSLLVKHNQSPCSPGQFDCKLCQLTFRSKSDLVKHRKFSVGVKKFFCRLCGHAFTKHHSLAQHLLRHSGEKAHVCAVCGKGFSTANDLKQHDLTHLSVKDRKHICQTCGHACVRLADLRLHQRVHSDDRPFQCETCGRSFRRLESLKHHHLNHTGERPYKCRWCEMRFKCYRSLRDHTETHIQGTDRPFACNLCSWAFKTLGKLRQHKRIHSGIKKHVCDICGKGFHTSSNLRIHKRVHSGEKPCICKVCGQAFRWESCLNKHKENCVQQWLC